MASGPVSISLFDADSAQERTYTQPVVSWGLLKRAVRLAGRLDTGDPSVRADLAALVALVFDERFSVDDLAEGADLSEQVAVIRQITRKAGELLPTSGPAAEAQPGEPMLEGAPGDWMVQIDRNLVRTYGWSLYEIDQTDIESLLPFLAPAAESAPKPKMLHCDEIGWL